MLGGGRGGVRGPSAFSLFISCRLPAAAQQSQHTPNIDQPIWVCYWLVQNTVKVILDHLRCVSEFYKSPNTWLLDIPNLSTHQLISNSKKRSQFMLGLFSQSPSPVNLTFINMLIHMQIKGVMQSVLFTSCLPNETSSSFSLSHQLNSGQGDTGKVFTHPPAERGQQYCFCPAISWNLIIWSTNSNPPKHLRQGKHRQANS